MSLELETTSGTEDSETGCSHPVTRSSDVDRFNRMANSVLAGQSLSREDAMAILDAPDSEVLDILAAGFRIRQKYFGRTVQLYFLMNAKSGLCPEDCHYCSQSKISEAPVPKYNILQRDKLMDAAAIAAQRGAKTYCLVISARGPNEREMRAVEQVVPEIKQKYGLDICWVAHA
jgi:biotin synthase